MGFAGLGRWDACFEGQNAERAKPPENGRILFSLLLTIFKLYKSEE